MSVSSFSWIVSYSEMKTRTEALVSAFQSDLRSLKYFEYIYFQYPIITTSLACSIRCCSCLSVVRVLAYWRTVSGPAGRLPSSSGVDWLIRLVIRLFVDTVKKRPCGALLTVSQP